MHIYKKMLYFPPTLILRHRRENLKKCSLRGLEKRSDLHFFTYPKASLPSLQGYLLLTLDAPPLTREDTHLGLFLIDGTWRHTKTMFDNLPGPHSFQKRSIPPSFATAYPRRQEDCPLPLQGLASIEALYIAYYLLGRPCEDLLDGYHWKAPFLEKNTALLTLRKCEQEPATALAKGIIPNPENKFTF
ncbi:MAG: hypothetical protein HYZ48_00090 [Chlamydiales bacterium]|nr:hypothetical protein [Chlamydiales bacterium]